VAVAPSFVMISRTLIALSPSANAYVLGSGQTG
jgi:hypothetical protein